MFAKLNSETDGLCQYADVCLVRRFMKQMAKLRSAPYGPNSIILSTSQAWFPTSLWPARDIFGSKPRRTQVQAISTCWAIEIKNESRWLQTCQKPGLQPV